MRKLSLRLWRIALQVVGLGAFVLFIVTPGTFLGLAVLALVAEMLALALELLGWRGGATLVRRLKEAAHGCARCRVMRAVRMLGATLLGVWLLVRTARTNPRR